MVYGTDETLKKLLQKRNEREYEYSHKYKHENIITIHEAYENKEKNKWFYVMEKYEDINLSDYYKHEKLANFDKLVYIMF